MALDFPEYFGLNWDATYDCLTNLAAQDTQPAAMLITHCDRYLAGMGPEWATAQRLFSEAAAFWQRSERRRLFQLVSYAPLEGLLMWSPTRLEQVSPPMDAAHEITATEDRISRLNRSGAFEEALQAAQDLVKRFPDNPRAHFVLAGTFDYQDREVEAVPPYQRAWELGLGGDDVPRFYVQYGSTLRNVGQFDESVRILREGQERFPDDAAITAFLALALFSSGRPADALAAALTVLIENVEAVDLKGYERALGEYIAELQLSGATP